MAAAEAAATHVPASEAASHVSTAESPAVAAAKAPTAMATAATTVAATAATSMAERARQTGQAQERNGSEYGSQSSQTGLHHVPLFPLHTATHNSDCTELPVEGSITFEFVISCRGLLSHLWTIDGGEEESRGFRVAIEQISTSAARFSAQRFWESVFATSKG
jgi:hypothetical protein